VPPSANYPNFAALPAPPVVTAIDACDPAPRVTHTSVTNNHCPIVIVNCWTATDACGNSTSACQTN